MMTVAQQQQRGLRTARRLATSIARSESEVREAQRLRWRVFAEEGGARLASEEHGYDIDAFDRHCMHLLVRDLSTDKVIGTYRILTGLASMNTGGFYSETEFDLGRLSHLRLRIAELGRSCVHPDYRTGGVINLLWAGIADVVDASGCDILIGCASVSMNDGGHSAAALYRRMALDHLAPLEYRVAPKTPVNLAGLNADAAVNVPPLMKGYLRAGATVCGAPHWDPDFNTADFLMMLHLSTLNHRYARHYLTPSQG
jgi:putative hemolysin